MMRIYDENKEVKKIFCNQCNRELVVENGILKEGCFAGNVVWGYFSSLDGKRHSFEMCEECYRKMISDFKIPVTETDETELV